MFCVGYEFLDPPGAAADMLLWANVQLGDGAEDELFKFLVNKAFRISEPNYQKISVLSEDEGLGLDLVGHLGLEGDVGETGELGELDGGRVDIVPLGHVGLQEGLDFLSGQLLFTHMGNIIYEHIISAWL